MHCEKKVLCCYAWSRYVLYQYQTRDAQAEWVPEGSEVFHITHRWVHPSGPRNVHIKSNTCTWSHLHRRREWKTNLITDFLDNSSASVCVCVCVCRHVFILPQELHCQERSFHHHSDEGRCRGHWDHCRRPAECHYHGECPVVTGHVGIREKVKGRLWNTHTVINILSHNPVKLLVVIIMVCTDRKGWPRVCFIMKWKEVRLQKCVCVVLTQSRIRILLTPSFCCSSLAVIATELKKQNPLYRQTKGHTNNSTEKNS